MDNRVPCNVCGKLTTLDVTGIHPRCYLKQHPSPSTEKPYQKRIWLVFFCRVNNTTPAQLAKLADIDESKIHGTSIKNQAFDASSEVIDQLCLYSEKLPIPKPPRTPVKRCTHKQAKLIDQRFQVFWCKYCGAIKTPSAVTSGRGKWLSPELARDVFKAPPRAPTPDPDQGP